MSKFLFNPIPNKTVKAYDFSDKIHLINLRNFKFRIGAYGILRKGNKILVQKAPELGGWGLPGGGVDMGESIFEGLIREYKEETGLDIKVGKLLLVTEDYFTNEGEDVHGIFITYEVKRISGKILFRGNNFDTIEVSFVSLKDLTEGSVMRVFWPIIKTLK